MDKQRLGELIDLIGTMGLGDKENRSKDLLGQVFKRRDHAHRFLPVFL